jgi:hypothetical protein
MNGPPRIARLELVGACNRCGLCCSIVHEGRRLVCEHLRARLADNRIPVLGMPEASWCGVYEQREDGMMVSMLDASGTVRLVGPCGKDSAQEDHMILDSGIGKGCSLTLKVHHGQLTAFTPAEG